MQDITKELAESFGLDDTTSVLVPGVLKDGPADLAGIKPGDILVAIAGKPMTHSSDVLNLVAELPPGEKVTITILREEKEMSVDILVGTRPQQIQRN